MIDLALHQDKDIIIQCFQNMDLTNILEAVHHCDRQEAVGGHVHGWYQSFHVQCIAKLRDSALTILTPTHGL